MPIEVTDRSKAFDGDIRKYVESKCEGIIEDFPKIEHIHVVMDKEKHVMTAEVIIQAGNHARMEAEESSENIKTSINNALEKIERQLRKKYDKVREHRKAMKHSETQRIKGV